MKKKIFSMALGVVLILGLAAPALAYSTPDFSDVPQNHWAYEAVMKMADAGVIKGTGNGKFSPEMKLSAEMFVVLVGRVVFPAVTAEGADWSGPYIIEAKTKGLLDGTNVTDANIKGDISRYDMAVILAKCVEILKVSASKADSSKVTDYGDVPNQYTDAVLMAYGSGLIRGDQSGRFNGANSMTRQEAATVMSRLTALAPSNSTNPGETPPPSTTTEPEKPEFTEPLEPEIVPMPNEEEMVSRTMCLRVVKVDHAIGRPRDDKYTFLAEVPVKLYYTPDGGKTAILVAEFNSPTKEECDADGELIYETFKAPESWSSYTSYKNGGGFYFSAETVLDGQHLVTSDLRTDGRAYADLQRLEPSVDPRMPIRYDVELTPTDGEKAKFTFKGHVVAILNQEYFETPLPNFSVQLHLENGQVVGETVSQADGSFSMECEVDALDGGFDISGKRYYYTASGYFNGDLYEFDGKWENKDALMLLSLVELDIYDDFGVLRKNPNREVSIRNAQRKTQ